MVATAAQEVAHHFGRDNFMGAFNLTLVIFSVFLVAANANLFIRIPHRNRIRIFLLISISSSIIIGIR
jgi:hypothetical protein